jgi:hypothetical protein
MFHVWVLQFISSTDSSTAETLVNAELLATDDADRIYPDWKVVDIGQSDEIARSLLAASAIQDLSRASTANVRLWHLADIDASSENVRSWR